MFLVARVCLYTQSDPMGLADGNNSFNYVNQNPLAMVDPLGLFKVRAEPTAIDSLGSGDPIHEWIVADAFERFNNAQGGNPRFSSYMIDLFIAGNLRTDLIFDAGHQFAGNSHFDNPNDTAWSEARQQERGAYWIDDTVQNIRNRRGNYRLPLASGTSCSTNENKPKDIRTLVEAFGANTHTLSDFYAHTNWVNPESDGGSYTQVNIYNAQYENGWVPQGLNQQGIFDFDNMDAATYNNWIRRLYSGNAEGCASFSCIGLSATLHTGTYYHNVIHGKDQNGEWDETTHAYWAKDDPEHVRGPESARVYNQARELAVQHVLREIELLWARSEGNDWLREIYAMDENQMTENEIVTYESEHNDLTGYLDCPFCPDISSWRDHEDRAGRTATQAAGSN